MNYIKNSDGTVSKVQNSIEVLETLTAEQIDQEILNTQNAIDDIDNFKQRRLDNLNNRLAELNQYKQILEAQ